MSFIKYLIKSRLGGYRQQLNRINTNLATTISEPKKVAVVGGGLAGISAAVYLAPRGFEIDVYEKESYIGGKVGSWPVTFDDDFTTDVEHGFHGFFPQYYNLLDLLKRVDASKYLMPIDDYLIKTLDRGDFSFRNIDTTPIINLLSLAKNKIYSLRDMMSVQKGLKMLPLLKYDNEKIFTRFDSLSFEEFSHDIGLPRELHLMFTTFARAFFAEPRFMSMAELIKSFHFYYLSNDLGILYDVLNDDFSKTLWEPIRTFLEPYPVKINTRTPIGKIDMSGDKFVIADTIYDYLIIASDVKHTPMLIGNSPDLVNKYPKFSEQMKSLKASQHYAVLRIWIDKDVPPDLPFFIFTDAVELLDSVTIYHRMETSSRTWVEKNGGGIFELHSYAVPENFKDGSDVRAQLLAEFEQYFPEVAGYQLRYEYFQFRDDFTAFHTDLYRTRPGHNPDVPNLYLAGDWVKLPCPAMLMEAATTSALLVANEIFQKENIQDEPVFSVPLKGILA